MSLDGEGHLCLTEIHIGRAQKLTPWDGADPEQPVGRPSDPRPLPVAGARLDHPGSQV